VTRLDGTATVAPSGELDMGTCPVLDGEMTRQRDDGVRALVVDLRGVTFIDSSAIHLLLRWADEADRSDLALRVIPGEGRVRRVFEVTGVIGRLSSPDPG
jgi:anti-anti-sigma factor